MQTITLGAAFEHIIKEERTVLARFLESEVLGIVREDSTEEIQAMLKLFTDPRMDHFDDTANRYCLEEVHLTESRRAELTAQFKARIAYRIEQVFEHMFESHRRLLAHVIVQHLQGKTPLTVLAGAMVYAGLSPYCSDTVESIWLIEDTVAHLMSYGKALMPWELNKAIEWREF